MLNLYNGSTVTALCHLAVNPSPDHPVLVKLPQDVPEVYCCRDLVAACDDLREYLEHLGVAETAVRDARFYALLPVRPSLN